MKRGSYLPKILKTSVCAVLCLSLAACGGKKECEHEYESEVISEASYQADGKIQKTCMFCDDEITEIIPQLENPIVLSVKDMETYEQEREPLVMPDGMEIFQPSIYWIIFEFDVENISDQDIAGFSGHLIIRDGDREIDSLLSIDESIDAGDSVHLEDYGFEVSDSDMSLADNMLMNRDLDDIEFEFILDEVDYR